MFLTIFKWVLYVLVILWASLLMFELIEILITPGFEGRLAMTTSNEWFILFSITGAMAALPLAFHGGLWAGIWMSAYTRIAHSSNRPLASFFSPVIFITGALQLRVCWFISTPIAIAADIHNFESTFNNLPYHESK